MNFTDEKVPPPEPCPARQTVTGPDGTQYAVSTIWRQCSALHASDLWYYETMAFRVVAGRLSDIVAQAESGHARGAQENQTRIAEALAAGLPYPPEEDE